MLRESVPSGRDRKRKNPIALSPLVQSRDSPEIRHKHVLWPASILRDREKKREAQTVEPGLILASRPFFRESNQVSRRCWKEDMAGPLGPRSRKFIRQKSVCLDFN